VIKGLLYGMARHSGFNALMRRRHRDQLLTICYHNALPDSAIHPRFSYRNTIGLTRLRAQLEILSRHFTFVTPGDVLRAVEGGALPVQPVLITFDDGYANMHEHVAPLLSQMGVPALFHVCSGVVGQQEPLWPDDLAWILQCWGERQVPLPDGSERPWPLAEKSRLALLRQFNAACKAMPDRERRDYLERLRSRFWRPPESAEGEAFRVMSWDEVRGLHRRGFGIGSHTHTHPILSRLEPEQLQEELVDSRRHIESEIEADCPYIAYPNGGPDDISAAVVEAAKLAGYRVGFTTTSGYSRPPCVPLEIGRWCAPATISDDAFAARCSGLGLRVASASIV